MLSWLVVGVCWLASALDCFLECISLGTIDGSVSVELSNPIHFLSLTSLISQTGFQDFKMLACLTHLRVIEFPKLINWTSLSPF